MARNPPFSNDPDVAQARRRLDELIQTLETVKTRLERAEQPGPVELEYALRKAREARSSLEYIHDDPRKLERVMAFISALAKLADWLHSIVFFFHSRTLYESGYWHHYPKAA